jgi:hypothetical protein
MGDALGWEIRDDRDVTIGRKPTLVQDHTLASLLTPDRVESRLGPLAFRDGAPTAETAETLSTT